jgi:predicted enzyme related to lactoylglutathione lyase
MSEVPRIIKHTVYEEYYGATGSGQISAGKRDIEYIRKDEYDKLEEALRFYEKELNIHYKDYENEGEYYIQLFEDEECQVPFGTTARNVLEKECEENK